MKKILNNLIYIVVVVYSVEILLFIFSSDLQKSLVNIKGQRIKIAKENNSDKILIHQKNLTYTFPDAEILSMMDVPKNIAYLYSPKLHHDIENMFLMLFYVIFHNFFVNIKNVYFS